MSARRSSRSITIVRGSRGARSLRALIGTLSCGTGFSGPRFLRSLIAANSGAIAAGDAGVADGAVGVGFVVGVAGVVVAAGFVAETAVDFVTETAVDFVTETAVDFVAEIVAEIAGGSAGIAGGGVVVGGGDGSSSISVLCPRFTRVFLNGIRGVAAFGWGALPKSSQLFLNGAMRRLFRVNVVA
jgi:hypothetical protein